ncbi:hypothetical protein [Georgenia soli]|uniref:hypothetical protein n=1 Tax=Georgenia soli TaxID=638953 RepID=UPI00117AC1B2|nr:hypothetical protein [Georgenia soli]
MTNEPLSGRLQAEKGGRRVPWPLRAAGALVLVEALVLVGMAVVLVTDVVRGVAPDVFSALALAVFFVGFAAMLAGSVRALWRGQRWGRGPVITWQVLQAASALTLTGVQTALVVLAVLVAAAAVAGVLWPSARDYASGTRAPGAVV